jgi:hypothetical protein
MLTSIHDPLADSNFCDESEKALMPAIVEDYNQHMGYITNSDRMVSSYSIIRLHGN